MPRLIASRILIQCIITSKLPGLINYISQIKITCKFIYDQRVFNVFSTIHKHTDPQCQCCHAKHTNRSKNKLKYGNTVKPQHKLLFARICLFFFRDANNILYHRKFTQYYSDIKIVIVTVSRNSECINTVPGPGEVISFKNKVCYDDV